MALVLVCAIGLLVLVSPRAAGADEPTPSESEPPAATAPMTSEAKLHYDRGLTLFASHQFAAAIRELQQGYAVDPRPEFLFAQAQAFRLAGDCSRAAPLYRQFLDASPSPIQIQATRLALGRCGPERTISPPPIPSQPPIRLVPAPERPNWWKDPWALSSLGVGATALSVGVGFFVTSNRTRDEATSMRTTNYFEYTRLWDEAEQRRTIAVTALIGGAALVAVGTIRLVIRTKTPPASLSFRGGPRGAAVIWEVGY